MEAAKATPALAYGASLARAAPPALPAPEAGLPAHAAGTPRTVASVEASVREARRLGKDEQEIHRLRAAQLPAVQVEAIARMEAAETSWRQRLEALQSACEANIGCEDARASFTREELTRIHAYAAPVLRQ